MTNSTQSRTGRLAKASKALRATLVAKAARNGKLNVHAFTDPEAAVSNASATLRTLAAEILARANTLRDEAPAANWTDAECAIREVNGLIDQIKGE